MKNKWGYEVTDLENWTDCTKSWCEPCGFDVRSLFYIDHLWIVHGLEPGELQPVIERVPGRLQDTA